MENSREFQDVLLNINQISIDLAWGTIKRTGFASTNRLDDLIQFIFVVSSIRPLSIPKLGQLCSIAIQENPQFKTKLEKKFKQEVFSNPMCRCKKIPYIEMYFHLFSLEILSKEFIIILFEWIKKIYHYWERIRYLSVFFVWFKPYIINHFMYKVYDMNIEFVSGSIYDPFYDSYLPRLLDHNQINELGIITDQYDIITMIKNDDLISLQELISQSQDFDFNMTVMSPKTHFFLQDFPSILQVCEFYCAIKCFKFLMVNGSEFGEYDGHYAVAGGNIEIIRILEQNNIIFNEYDLNIAAYFHHYDLYNWIYDSKDLLSWNAGKFAARTNNFSYFIREKDEEYFHKAVKYGYVEIVSMFELDMKDFDKYLNLAMKYKRKEIIRHWFQYIKKSYVLHWAAWENDLDFAKELLEYGIEINFQNIDKSTPLDIAHYRKNYHMIKLFKSYGGLRKNRNIPRRIVKKLIRCRINDNNNLYDTELEYDPIDSISSLFPQIEQKHKLDLVCFDKVLLNGEEVSQFMRIVDIGMKKSDLLQFFIKLIKIQ